MTQPSELEKLTLPENATLREAIRLCTGMGEDDKYRVLSQFCERLSTNIRSELQSLIQQEKNKARIEEVSRVPRADYNTVDEYIDTRIKQLKAVEIIKGRKSNEK